MADYAFGSNPPYEFWTGQISLSLFNNLPFWRVGPQATKVQLFLRITIGRGVASWLLENQSEVECVSAL
jgi:hypothetical protein